MGKKAVEMGRYGASELMRNKNLQKKAVNYGVSKLTPFIQDSVGTAMDQLSTKVRPNKKYKTDRKDLDGAGIVDSALTSGAFGSPYHVDFKKGFQLLTDPDLFKQPSGDEIKDAKARVKYYKEQYKKAKANGYKGSYTSFVKKKGWAGKPSFTIPGFGGAIDIHKQIGKLPKPKGGWTLPGHKYTGPYNDLENQVLYNPETGEILEIYDQPTGPTDAVAMQHGVDYSVCGDDRKCKNKADRKMVKSLDAIPWKERQWGHTLARTIINTKQKLGLGLNASRR